MLDFNENCIPMSKQIRPWPMKIVGVHLASHSKTNTNIIRNIWAYVNIAATKVEHSLFREAANSKRSVDRLSVCLLTVV